MIIKKFQGKTKEEAIEYAKKELGEGIWQRSFYEHVIRGEQDYWEIVKYIEENPAKWYYRRGG